MTFDKGKVESGVGHAKRTPLKGQRFESLQQAQAYLDRSAAFRKKGDERRADADYQDAVKLDPGLAKTPK